MRLGHRQSKTYRTSSLKIAPKFDEGVLVKIGALIDLLFFKNGMAHRCAVFGLQIGKDCFHLFSDLAPLARGHVSSGKFLVVDIDPSWVHDKGQGAAVDLLIIFLGCI
jgi:hypothetical protein